MARTNEARRARISSSTAESTAELRSQFSSGSTLVGRDLHLVISKDQIGRDDRLWDGVAVERFSLARNAARRSDDVPCRLACPSSLDDTRRVAEHHHGCGPAAHGVDEPTINNSVCRC